MRCKAKVRTLAPALVVLIAASGLFVTAASGRADEAGWQALTEPGAVAIMRHALAPGTGDPPTFTLNDCSTQRNLDQAGREQARAIGQSFRDKGVAFDRVLTSQWCRCRETAELLEAGPVEDFPALNSFFRDRSTRDQQTRATREFLTRLDRSERVILVTHQVNISALTGAYTSSGEVLVIRVDGDGTVDVRGRILIGP